MPLHRTIALIDGFNLYHAIASLRRPELKWVNLKILSGTFIKTLQVLSLTAPKNIALCLFTPKSNKNLSSSGQGPGKSPCDFFHS